MSLSSQDEVARIAAVERDVSHLDEQLRSLTRSVTDSFDSIRSAIRSIESQGTNWGVLGTWSAVMISVIGGLGYLALVPIKNAMVEHIRLDGHPAAMVAYAVNEEKVSSNTKRMIDLDVTLQREMRLLDDTAKTRVESLDEMLQREVRLLDARLESIVGRNQEDIKAIRQWQEAHDVRVVGMNATQSERLRAIERHVFGEKGKIE